MIRVELEPPQRHAGHNAPKVDGKWFTRPSKLPQYLEDRSGLARWSERNVAKGIALNHGLYERARQMSPDDPRWGDIAKTAQEAAGSTDAREYGTLLHSATEAIDYGHEPTGTDDVKADAEAYRRACEELGIEVLAAEFFVANAEMAVAGTMDRLIVDAEGIARVLDIKTVKPDADSTYASRYSGFGWSIQLSCYSRGLPYCGERGYLNWDDVGLRQPARNRAIVIGIPRGTGTYFAVDVDLIKGYELAQLACQVREARRVRPAKPLTGQTAIDTEGEAA